MNTKKLDAVIDEIEGKILLDLAHTIEDLMGQKPVLQLATSEQRALLDYLFGDEPYPIEEDRDYRELGDIFAD